MKNLPRTAIAFAASGLAGYLGEKYLLKSRPTSAVGSSYPFLPVYAVGGAAVSLIEPHLRELPWWQRAFVYGVSLTGVEYAGCLADRLSNGGKRAWDYGEGPGGCTTWKHAVAWAVLGLGAEAVVRKL